MKRIINIVLVLVSFFMLFNINIYAQSFAPLKPGNIWVYFNYSQPTTIRTYFVADTIVIIGKKQYQMAGGRPMRFNAADSLYYQYYYSDNIEWPYYKDKCIKGDTFYYFITPNPLSKVTIAVIATYLTRVFDTVLTVKIIHKNVGGLVESYQVWTDELGELSAIGHPPGEVWYDLKGCVINGRVYGDTSIATDVKDGKINVLNYNLSQNYPNPFNSTTKIDYEIKRRSFVTLDVFNLLGEKIETLVNEEKQSGRYTAIFSERNLPGGIYFYKLTAGGNFQTRKMILLK